MKYQWNEVQKNVHRILTITCLTLSSRKNILVLRSQEERKMKETLAYQILILYKEFLAYTTEKLKVLGLSFGQMPLVVYVGKHPGCSQADLTKALRLDWGYSQRSIAKLTDTGFMTKEHRKEGGCNFLELTELGKQAFNECHKVFYEWDQIKMKNFTDDEKNEIIEFLKQIIN